MILWFDLRHNKSQPCAYADLCNSHQIHYLANRTELPVAIKEMAPRVLCFEYDYPDLTGLKYLQQTKEQHHSLPIVMLTQHHSENLAIWAFRTRVWDYLVKPIEVSDFSSRIAILLKIPEVHQSKNEKRVIFTPPCSLPVEFRYCGSPQNGVTAPAISFIEMNWNEKITLNKAACVCNLGRFQFSRIFKREQGITFREYLIKYRVNKGQELLSNPDISITDVAFTCGFSNLSEFSKMFCRYLGICPSEYRSRRGL